MKYTRPFLISRLRFSRGLWAVAFLALLFKFASATVCLQDPLMAKTGDNATLIVAAQGSGATDAGGCLLGEGSGCHCLCVHAAPMPPADASHRLVALEPMFLPQLSSVPFVSAPLPAPHRPPIA